MIEPLRLLRPQDAAKLAFQAAYGAEHLLPDSGAGLEEARARFLEEFEACEKTPGPPLERISPDTARAGLPAWKEAGLPPEWLFGLFLGSARAGARPDAEEALAHHLADIGGAAYASLLPFSHGEWREYVRGYAGGPVRHSGEYREKERPAYRVLTGPFAAAAEILYGLRGLRAATVGIDGRAASGKTSVADALADALGTEPVRMDDFFLPPDLRTPGRLAEPGGNVHYERFLEEAAGKLAAREALAYRPFCCRAMGFGPAKTIGPAPFMVVEGAYSHHPIFGGYLDLRVFGDVDGRTQFRRIARRNGPAACETYRAEWVPMEERYLAAFGIREKAHMSFGGA